MRVTNRILHDDALRSLSANLAALQAIQEQVASGRRLNRPSDDPANVRTALKVRDALAELQQYLRNLDGADRLLSGADGALAAATDAVQRARELAIQGANGTLSAADRVAMAQEVAQLEDHLVQLAATRVGDAYIFSGYRTDRPPYASPSGPYQGDSGAIVARIAPGAGLQVNVTGDTAFGPALAALEQLRSELAAGSPVSSSTIGALDGAQSAVLDARAVIGARQNRVSEARTTLENATTATEKLLSDLQDVDMAAAISELAQRQTSYQAALRVNALVLQQSLVDFLSGR
jgi:flagellar hook-associated protein 3 FlgL